MESERERVGTNVETNVGTTMGTNVETKLGTNVETKLGTNVETKLGTNVETKLGTNVVLLGEVGERVGWSIFALPSATADLATLKASLTALASLPSGIVASIGPVTFQGQSGPPPSLPLPAPGPPLPAHSHPNAPASLQSQPLQQSQPSQPGPPQSPGGEAWVRWIRGLATSDGMSAGPDARPTGSDGGLGAVEVIVFDWTQGVPQVGSVQERRALPGVAAQWVCSGVWIPRGRGLGGGTSPTSGTSAHRLRALAPLPALRSSVESLLLGPLVGSGPHELSPAGGAAIEEAFLRSLLDSLHPAMERLGWSRVGQAFVQSLAPHSAGPAPLSSPQFLPSRGSSKEVKATGLEAALEALLLSGAEPPRPTQTPPSGLAPIATTDRSLLGVEFSFAMVPNWEAGTGGVWRLLLHLRFFPSLLRPLPPASPHSEPSDWVDGPPVDPSELSDLSADSAKILALALASAKSSPSPGPGPSPSPAAALPASSAVVVKALPPTPGGGSPTGAKGSAGSEVTDDGAPGAAHSAFLAHRGKSSLLLRSPKGLPLPISSGAIEVLPSAEGGEVGGIKIRRGEEETLVFIAPLGLLAIAWPHHSKCTTLPSPAELGLWHALLPLAALTSFVPVRIADTEFLMPDQSLFLLASPIAGAALQALREASDRPASPSHPATPLSSASPPLSLSPSLFASGYTQASNGGQRGKKSAADKSGALRNPTPAQVQATPHGPSAATPRTSTLGALSPSVDFSPYPTAPTARGAETPRGSRDGPALSVPLASSRFSDPTFAFAALDVALRDGVESEEGRLFLSGSRAPECRALLATVAHGHATPRLSPILRPSTAMLSGAFQASLRPTWAGHFWEESLRNEFFLPLSYADLTQTFADPWKWREPFVVPVAAPMISPGELAVLQAAATAGAGASDLFLALPALPPLFSSPLPSLLFSLKINSGSLGLSDEALAALSGSLGEIPREGSTALPGPSGAPSPPLFASLFPSSRKRKRQAQTDDPSLPHSDATGDLPPAKRPKSDLSPASAPPGAYPSEATPTDPTVPRKPKIRFTTGPKLSFSTPTAASTSVSQLGPGSGQSEGAAPGGVTHGTPDGALPPANPSSSSASAPPGGIGSQGLGSGWGESFGGEADLSLDSAPGNFLDDASTLTEWLQFDQLQARPPGPDDLGEAKGPEAEGEGDGEGLQMIGGLDDPLAPAPSPLVDPSPAAGGPPPLGSDGITTAQMPELQALGTPLTPDDRSGGSESIYSIARHLHVRPSPLPMGSPAVDHLLPSPDPRLGVYPVAPLGSPPRESVGPLDSALPAARGSVAVRTVPALPAKSVRGYGGASSSGYSPVSSSVATAMSYAFALPTLDKRTPTPKLSGRSLSPFGTARSKAGPGMGAPPGVLGSSLSEFFKSPPLLAPAQDSTSLPTPALSFGVEGGSWAGEGHGDGREEAQAPSDGGSESSEDSEDSAPVSPALPSPALSPMDVELPAAKGIMNGGEFPDFPGPTPIPQPFPDPTAGRYPQARTKSWLLSASPAPKGPTPPPRRPSTLHDPLGPNSPSRSLAKSSGERSRLSESLPGPPAGLGQISASGLGPGPTSPLLSLARVYSQFAAAYFASGAQLDRTPTVQLLSLSLSGGGREALAWLSPSPPSLSVGSPHGELLAVPDLSLPTSPSTPSVLAQISLLNGALGEMHRLVVGPSLESFVPLPRPDADPAPAAPPTSSLRATALAMTHSHQIDLDSALAELIESEVLATDPTGGELAYALLPSPRPGSRSLSFASLPFVSNPSLAQLTTPSGLGTAKANGGPAAKLSASLAPAPGGTHSALVAQLIPHFMRQLTTGGPTTHGPGAEGGETRQVESVWAADPGESLVWTALSTLPWVSSSPWGPSAVHQGLPLATPLLAATARIAALATSALFQAPSSALLEVFGSLCKSPPAIQGSPSEPTGRPEGPEDPGPAQPAAPKASLFSPVGLPTQASTSLALLPPLTPQPSGQGSVRTPAAVDTPFAAPPPVMLSHRRAQAGGLPDGRGKDRPDPREARDRPEGPVPAAFDLATPLFPKTPLTSVPTSSYPWDRQRAQLGGDGEEGEVGVWGQGLYFAGDLLLALRWLLGALAQALYGGHSALERRSSGEELEVFVAGGRSAFASAFAPSAGPWALIAASLPASGPLTRPLSLSLMTTYLAPELRGAVADIARALGASKLNLAPLALAAHPPTHPSAAYSPTSALKETFSGLTHTPSAIETFATAPRVLVSSGAGCEWVEVDPGAVYYWEKANLRPYSPAKQISYCLLAPDNPSLRLELPQVLDQLSLVYFQCNLGTHTPVEKHEFYQLLTAAGFAPPQEGIIWLPLTGATTDDPTGGTDREGQMAQYREACKRIGEALAKLPRDYDKTVVIYVLDPFLAPPVPLFRSTHPIPPRPGPDTTAKGPRAVDATASAHGPLPNRPTPSIVASRGGPRIFASRASVGGDLQSGLYWTSAVRSLPEPIGASGRDGSPANRAETSGTPESKGRASAVSLEFLHALRSRLSGANQGIPIVFQALPWELFSQGLSVAAERAMKEIAFLIFNKARRVTFATHYIAYKQSKAQVGGAMAKPQARLQAPRLYEPIFVLAPPPVAPAYSQHTLHVAYSLESVVTTSAQAEKFLLTACCVDARGELLEVKAQVTYRSVNIALHYLWSFLVKMIPHTTERWRVVVGRLMTSPLSSGEVHEWESLLRDEARSEEFASVHISEVVLVSLVPGSHLLLSSAEALPTADPQSLGIAFYSPISPQQAEDFAVSIGPNGVQAAPEGPEASDEPAKSRLVSTLFNFPPSASQTFHTPEHPTPLEIHLHQCFSLPSAEGGDGKAMDLVLTDAQMELRSRGAAVVRDYWGLSWLNISPSSPHRHSLLPLHYRLTLQLARQVLNSGESTPL